METNFKNQNTGNPEKDGQLKKNKGKDDLDSDLNTSFHKNNKMESQTNDEAPDTDPNKVPDKPGFKRTKS